jgi:hypothetical protein
MKMKKNIFLWVMNLPIAKSIKSISMNPISIDLEASKPTKIRKSQANLEASPRIMNLTKALKVLWVIQV